MSTLLLQLVKAIVGAMAVALTPEKMKVILDAAFDKIEEKVKSSETQWDDVVFIPVLKAIRVALDIPDGDDAGNE